MPEADATKAKDELAGKLGLRSVPEFLGYSAIFDGGLVTFWKSVPEWQQENAARGGIFASLRTMLNSLSRMEKQAVGAQDQIMDPTLDNPIDAKTNKTLTGTWLQAYGYRLHPTQEATNQILGSMWRSLQNRQIQADPIVGLKTLESTHGIEPWKKTWNLGDFRLLGPEDQKGSSKSYSLDANPFLFLIAVEVLLRTLAQACTY